MGLLKVIFGDQNAKELKRIEKTAQQVEALDGEIRVLTDDQLCAKTAEFKARLQAGESLDDILPEAFAVCREASSRVLGMKHFHVQIIGGIVLHEGNIAEMKTGEGKTLVATLPVYLNALEGKGVHVVTVNDYLAQRDMEWMGRLYNFLGLSVGCITHSKTGEERREAYNADITYGTNNEFGFDYLRDNMATYSSQLLQRELHYAIVDEVDSILIDEARTPLIISGVGVDSSDLYRKADSFVRTLIRGVDYTVDEKEKTVSIGESGIEKCEKSFGISNFADPENMEINHHVQIALKAHNLMKRDIDYISDGNEIIIVDEFTGRLMYGRRYSDGLHQAIEAKEGISVKSESKTLATITLQNYFRMYGKLSGMTGTAKTEEEEFIDIYNMKVIEVPTNKPVIRHDMDDQVYGTQAGKFRAVADSIAEYHATGRPVLVGTVSVEKSEMLSDMLKRRGVPHNVLNAKLHMKEAEIIAQAGREGAVTIATNMAGRGTDILLGGNPEFEARRELRKQGYDPGDISRASNIPPGQDDGLDELREKYARILADCRQKVQPEQERVRALGGLHIIGTERHEARRIDNQLRGRSGRQGDPGSSQFFIALDDDLMRFFGGERMQGMVEKLGVDEDTPIEAGMLTRTIENAQKKVEGRNYSIRKYVLQYDDVMNRQRSIIYAERKRVLMGEDLKEHIQSMMRDIATEITDYICAGSEYPEEWDMAELNKKLRETSPFLPELAMSGEELMAQTKESLIDAVMGVFNEAYDQKEAEIGTERLRELERMLLLMVVDRQWMDHIDAMDQLKAGINLRSIGQQDPAQAYANEGSDMFELMVKSICDEIVKYVFALTVETDAQRHARVAIRNASKEEASSAAEEERSRRKAMTQVKPPAARPAGTDNSGEKPQPVRVAKLPGRNDPCPCGSGKKYKNCCGRNQ